MKISHIIFPVLLLLSSAQVHSQNQALLDSLQNELKQDIHDTLRLHIMNKIAWKLKRSNLDTSFTIARQSLELARKLEDEVFIDRANAHLGVF